MISFSSIWRKNGPEFHAFLIGGIPSFVAAADPRPLSDGVPVFCYHSVARKRFTRDLEFLERNGYRMVTADALVSHCLGRQPLPSNSVVLTFDDGSDNFFRVALPVLKQFDASAILFVAPGLHRSATEEADEPGRPCTWEELDAIHDSGLVDIQSHTWAHRSIPMWPEPIPLDGVNPRRIADRLGPPMSLLDDLCTARDALAQRFGKPVRHLAWPHYETTTLAVETARSAGYAGLWGGTCPDRPLNAPGQSPESIVRISGEFLCRLPGRDRTPLSSILLHRYSAALRKRSTLRKEISQ